MKDRSTAIALIISTIMIASAFSMVYADGDLNSSSTHVAASSGQSSVLNANNMSIQTGHVSASKLKSDNLATQISPDIINPNNNVKYLSQQYSRLSVNQHLYPVYFNQTGLPIGEPWNITINGDSVQTFNISYLKYLPGGKYNYSISKSGNFYPSVGEGTFTLNSSGVEVQVYFQSSLSIKNTLVMYNNSFVSGVYYPNKTNHEFYKPYAAVFNPFNGFYYVANLEKASVSIINENGQIYKNVKVGSEPISLTYNPSNGEVYVANFGSSTVSVIDLNLSVSENLTIINSPSNVLFDPFSGNLFVSNHSEVVGILSPNGTIRHIHFNSGVGQLVLDSNNGNVFVKTSIYSNYNNTIKPYFTNIYYVNSNGAIINSFNVSSNQVPYFIAFDSAENTLYTVTPYASNNQLTEVNSAGNILESWNLNYSPFDIFYDKYSGNIFILGYNNENTVISTYSGGMNLMGSMYVEGEIQDIAFQNKGEILPDSYVDAVYYASPVTLTREVSITEKGLKTGTLWGFNYSGHEFLTRSSVINFTSFFSPISIQFLNETGYVLNNNLTIPYGTNSFLYSIQYHRTYPVTIFEKGLPKGTKWNATIGGIAYSSSNVKIVVNLTNGTYSLEVQKWENYYPDPSNITLNINGSGLNLSLLFSTFKYSVNFNEKGLPLGSIWYLNLSNGDHFVSHNSTISLLLPNNTYFYSISSINHVYRPVAYTGSFTVNGSELKLAVNFIVVTYRVNFTETGLPAGVPWYIEINDSGNYVNINSSGLSINLENGTYSYSVKTTNKSYYPSKPTGIFTIDGLNITLNTVFEELKFNVTVSQSSLPSGSIWYFNLSNGDSMRISGTSASIMLPNGTYYYSASSVNKTFKPSVVQAYLVVNGSPVTINITFKLVVYNVTFSLSNITTNNNWSLYLNNRNVTTSSLPETHVDLSNGSYTYSIDLWNHIYKSTSANFTVDGHNIVVDISIKSMRYTVNVEEAGLPQNSIWYLNLSNGVNLYSQSNIISVLLTNGTYHYDLSSSNSSFHPSFLSGTLVVSGSNLTITVTFKLTLYNVTFEGGSNIKGSWYVNLINGNNSGPISSGSSHVFALSNGTYSYVISTSNGSFVPSLFSGVFTVNGTNVLIHVQFIEVNYTVTFTYNLHRVPWQITIDNESEFSPHGQPITFELPNGTYFYSAFIYSHGMGRHYVPYVNGTVTISGKNVTIDLLFKKLNNIYVKILTPPNTKWILSINGTSYTPSSLPMYIQLPDGNYSSFFNFNLSMPGPSPGPTPGPIPGLGQQVGGPDMASYINRTVDFYLNVSGPMNVFLILSPPPVELSIIIISPQPLPPPPPPPPMPLPSINSNLGLYGMAFPPSPVNHVNNIPGLFQNFMIINPFQREPVGPLS
ncbi:hypothetical protein OXIME_000713 [Oxyplasma meridianum]|uniref:Uncharacterized protein n=1 Tax=Oxyplasma meridianum TaxID=3073602 RepID=A0AAX4NH82_9ARCH